MRNSDDGYGKEWDYRVLSYPDTEPGKPEGQRYLEIHEVTYERRSREIAEIEYEHAAVVGSSIPDLLATLGRMEKALDRPALIAAECRDVMSIPFEVLFGGSRAAVVELRREPHEDPRIELWLSKRQGWHLDLAYARRLHRLLGEALALGEKPVNPVR